MELTPHFRGLLRAIEPSSTAVSTAKRSHEKLRDILKNDEEVSQADPDSYLAGSYARDTAINDIKDVDIILLLDLDHTKTPPDVVVAWLHAALLRYPDDYPKVRSQGRSVQATTPEGFDLDVVPSVPLSRRDGPIWIPDRDAGQWVASHPKGQISFGVQRNAASDGYYKHLVKIMKQWRDRLSPTSAQAKSYVLESLVAENISSRPTSYAHGVVRILQGIDGAYAAYVDARVVPSIADPGYPSVNVAKRWKYNEFAEFMKNVKGSRAIAEEALRATDKDRSVALWRKLFGAAFEAES